ncbi:MAG: hypothetical protein KBT29_11715 [Prevotellaceae bacterium]|nr:hypothetical protein [Candidatus Minthosoma caballi]
MLHPHTQEGYARKAQLVTLVKPNSLRPQSQHPYARNENEAKALPRATKLLPRAA